MKKEIYPFEQIAGEIGISPGDAEYATCRFLQWLAGRIRNYEEGNRDFIGEQLHWQVSRATFYHLLGLFDEFSGRYSWEMGIAKDYLMRIAPREDWPGHDDESTAPSKLTAGSFAESMLHICDLVFDHQFDIKLVVCELNSRLYARIRVSEETFAEDGGFTMIDYVPLSPADLPRLVGLEDHPMLLLVQEISKERECIITTRGQARWTDRVFYPHT